MARKKREPKTLPTIWEVDDQLWSIAEPILAEHDPSTSTGRPRIRLREALNGIIYQMRSGCQWNQLPKIFGDDSSIHRTLQRWKAKGVFQRIWMVLAEKCEERVGLDWNWQSADGAMGRVGFASRKARFGGTMSAPIRRIAASLARAGRASPSANAA